MYIVYFKLGKEPCVKHFNDKEQALAFGTMCKERQDDDVRVLHMDPTNPSPIVITLDKALNKAGISIMPADEDEIYIAEQAKAQDYIDDEVGIFEQIPSNEYELILEDALSKVYGLFKGFAEQLKRIGG